eukprot:s1152_g18.t1
MDPSLQCFALQAPMYLEMMAGLTCKGTVSPTCHDVNKDTRLDAIFLNMIMILQRFDQDSIRWIEKRSVGSPVQMLSRCTLHAQV